MRSFIRYLFVLIPWSLAMYFLFLAMQNDPVVAAVVFILISVVSGLVIQEKS